MYADSYFTEKPNVFFLSFDNGELIIKSVCAGRVDEVTLTAEEVQKVREFLLENA